MAITREQLRTILNERVLLLDGGMGTMLLARGLAAGQAPEAWLFEYPEHIVDVHRQYVKAGCDVITTASFGGSPPKLRAAGLPGRCRDANTTAVQLAREACGPTTFIAGNVGPSGEFLPPMGAATEEQLVVAFEEQTRALADAGADLILIETMFDLREALAAVKAAASMGLPLFACMTFEVKKKGTFTIMGDPLVGSLRRLADAGADIVGCNCSVESQPMLSMVREAAPALEAPILAQPNAGQPRPTPDGVVYEASPKQFVRDLVEMIEAGARAVGGCCGTDPSFMARGRKALDSMGPR